VTLVGKLPLALTSKTLNKDSACLTKARRHPSMFISAFICNDEYWV